MDAALCGPKNSTDLFEPGQSSEETVSNGGPFLVEHREIDHVSGSPAVGEELAAERALLGRTQGEESPGVIVR